MSSEDDLFKIRTELAVKRFAGMYDKGCYSFNGAYLCTGTLEMKFSKDQFVAECGLCGDQSTFESKTFREEVEQICLLRMIDQPDVVSVAL